MASTSYRSAIAAAVKEQSQLLQQGHKIQFGRTHINVSRSQKFKSLTLAALGKDMKYFDFTV